MKRYEVWRTTSPGFRMLAYKTRWRWWARFYAWEHTRRGRFVYEARDRLNDGDPA